MSRMPGARERARSILSQIPPGSHASNAASGVYQKYTNGLTHQSMLTSWTTRNDGYGVTGCMAFVGWYAGQLGVSASKGWFDLEASLYNDGKIHAFIRSAPGAAPRYGDILKHAINHVDVAMEFDGDVLYRMAAGQGGFKRKPNTAVEDKEWVGADILTRVRGTGAFDPKDYQGWLDIERYFERPPTNAPRVAPSWLVGWWTVTWEGQTFYYFFRPDCSVEWTRTAPVGNAAPPARDDSERKGTVTDAAFDKIRIDWVSGTMEEYETVGAATTLVRNSLAGKWRNSPTSNEFSPIKAKKR